MTRRVFAATAVATLGSMCVSCGGPAAGLSAVSGKVVCNGQPAAGAVLSFHRQAGEPPPPQAAANLIPSAVVQNDGGFVVETHPLGYGAAPGKYAILVQWSQQSDPAQSRGTGKPQVAMIKGKRVVMTKHDKLEPRSPTASRDAIPIRRSPCCKSKSSPAPTILGHWSLS